LLADKPGIHEIPVEQILSKKEGNMVVIDLDVLAPKGMAYIFPYLYDYNPSTRMVIYLWRNYIGRDRPRLHPKFEIVEDSQNYMIVRRHDGQLFKIANNFAGEILGNIYINSGKSLWDIVVLESMIEAKRNPRFGEKDYRAWYAEKVVDVVGILAFIADLVEMTF